MVEGEMFEKSSSETLSFIRDGSLNLQAFRFYFDILRLFGLAFSLYTCGFLGYFGVRFSTTFSRISFFMHLPVGTLIGKGGID